MEKNIFEKNFSIKKKHILIVEDDDTSFKYFKEALYSIKALFLRAKNGKEAVDICRENKNIDLILMDIQMPIMNGNDAAKEIKKFRKKLPIIAQTAYIIDGEKEKSLKAGCCDYLTKPIKPNMLIETVNRYISAN